MQSFVILAIIFIAPAIIVTNTGDGGDQLNSQSPSLGYTELRGKSEVWYENPNLNKLSINYFKYGTQKAFNNNT